MPLLEEIEDDNDVDNMDMDLAEFDPSLTTPLAPARPAPSVQRSQDSEPPLFPNIPLDNQISEKQVIRKDQFSEEEMAELKSFQIIYPCYFDKNRSVKQGRRVKAENAVANPLAKTILDACKTIGVPTILEPEKSHPQDFGNPGRVRVALKEGGKSLNNAFSSKRKLMLEISAFLKKHPTTLEKLREMPAPPELASTDYRPERIPVVKGFKMNDIVPLHSPFTIKNPVTKSVYDPEPAAAQIPQPPTEKRKIMKIRR